MAKSVKALLMRLLYQLPLSMIAALISVPSRMREIRGVPALAAFQSVEDAINYAIDVPADEEGSVPHRDPLLRE
jgi:hypothetical protein